MKNPIQGGFYDPPRTLGVGLHLVPTTTAGSIITPPPAAPEQPVPQGPASTPHLTPTELANPAVTPAATSGSSPSRDSTENGGGSQQPHDPALPADLPGSTITIVLGPPAPAQPGDPAEPIFVDPKPPVITLAPHPGQQPSSITVIVTVITPSLPEPTNGDGTTLAPSAPVSGVIIGSQALLPGSMITIGATTSTLNNGAITVDGGVNIRLDGQGENVVVGGTSIIPITLPGPATPLVIRLEKETFTLVRGAKGGVIIGPQILMPGSSMVLAGTTVFLQFDSSTIWMNDSPVPIPLRSNIFPSILTLGSETLTHLRDGSNIGVIIGTQTLKPGSTLTLLGTTFILDQDMKTLLINNSLLFPVATPTITPAAQRITLARTTLIPDSVMRFTFGSQVLSAGGLPVTYSGTTYSMISFGDKTVLVVGSAGTNTTYPGGNIPGASQNPTQTHRSLIVSELTKKVGSAKATTTTSGAAQRRSYAHACIVVRVALILAFTALI
jgi:hypothetical protein